uniref:DNA topoisomerase I n=2 Tax=Scleropages formosus TaxID=113540 RepID=A0A8C9RIU2_SCLFO
MLFQTKTKNAKQSFKKEEKDGPVQEDDQVKEILEDKAIKTKELKGHGKSCKDENDQVNPRGKDKHSRDGGDKLKPRKRKKDQTEANDTKNKRRKKEEIKTDTGQERKEEDDKWKWWEEGRSQDGKKWKTLEHKGPLFPPEYEPLPQDVSFYYNGKPLRLSIVAEEVATFYAKMLDHEYTSKEIFQKNFFTDWREEMTAEERDLICEFSKCDFGEMHRYFVEQSEKKKDMSKEEKEVLKEETKKLTEEYGYCLLDGHKEKIGNFRVEPPGLFRGRGEHPKMGKLKKRILPEDIIINCSNDSKTPEPPKGHKWKEVRHDDTVTWLASWVENVQGSIKYIMLNPSSKLKGEKDWQKYEIARKLKLKVETIRKEYERDWKSKEMKKRQKGVAVYFIDKLALRAGNEKEEGETADTVGCCSLRVEHITLHKELDGQECVVEFDFLGKDSIRYYNKVPVDKRVFKNLKLFMENKNPEDDLFDRINTTYLNKTLNNSMTGLTAKVFRTYNASTTLQEQLSKLTSPNMTLEEKLLSYNRANRAVAILCNHQRTAPKTFEKSMQNLQQKIELKQKQLDEAKAELKKAKSDYRESKTEKLKRLVEQKEKMVKRLQEQLKKLQLQMTDREENKVIALGTSKLNYLDPRISVAWCKKFDVPIEKIYNKTQRDKFAWAIDMTNEDFEF